MFSTLQFIKNLEFRDSAIRIWSAGDAQMTIECDSEIEMAAAYVKIGNGATNEARLRLMENASNGSNYVTFGAPATLGGDYTFTLPNGNGTDGYALTTNGSGVTSWSAMGGQSTSVKSVQTFAAAVSKNNGAATDSGISAIDLSAITLSNANKAIDVFINGQLLVSGTGPFTENIGTSGTGDYLMDFSNGGANLATADFKFAFGVEADDVLIVIGRA